MRIRRSLAVAAVTLASVSWGATASAAPHAKSDPARQPILVPHLMSSCGNMDGI